MFKPNKIAIVGATYPELELYCPNFVGMQAGLKRLGIPFIFVTCRPDFNAQEVIDFNPDLVVYALRDCAIHNEWRRELKNALPNAKFVLWYGDYRDSGTGQIEADISDLDCMFISNDNQEKFYKFFWKAKRVEFLPLGAEPLEKPIYNAKFDLPFIFVGGQITSGAFANRSNLIQRFRDDAHLALINSFDPHVRLKIMKAIPEIYSSAKVVLDISHFTHAKGYTSNRYWVIPANFGFALTKRWPGCEEFYPEDCRAYFDTYEEAIEKRNYYLTHEDERRAMIERAHKHSWNHSYDKRFLRMFELLKNSDAA